MSSVKPEAAYILRDCGASILVADSAVGEAAAYAANEAGLPAASRYGVGVIGFRSDSSEAERPAFDDVIQAETGIPRVSERIGNDVSYAPPALVNGPSQLGIPVPGDQPLIP
jgi:hypothetical protein